MKQYDSTVLPYIKVIQSDTCITFNCWNLIFQGASECSDVQFITHCHSAVPVQGCRWYLTGRQTKLIDLTSTFHGLSFWQLSVNLLLFFSDPCYYITTILLSCIWKEYWCEILWTTKPCLAPYRSDRYCKWDHILILKSVC